MNRLYGKALLVLTLQMWVILGVAATDANEAAVEASRPLLIEIFSRIWANEIPRVDFRSREKAFLTDFKTLLGSVKPDDYLQLRVLNFQTLCPEYTVFSKGLSLMIKQDDLRDEGQRQLFLKGWRILKGQDFVSMLIKLKTYRAFRKKYGKHSARKYLAEESDFERDLRHVIASELSMIDNLTKNRTDLSVFMLLVNSEEYNQLPEKEKKAYMKVLIGRSGRLVEALHKFSKNYQVLSEMTDENDLEELSRFCRNVDRKIDVDYPQTKPYLHFLWDQISGAVSYLNQTFEKEDE